MKRVMLLVVVNALVAVAFLVGRSTVQGAVEQTQVHFVGMVGGIAIHYPTLGKLYVYDTNTSRCKAALRISGAVVVKSSETVGVGIL